VKDVRVDQTCRARVLGRLALLVLMVVALTAAVAAVPLSRAQAASFADVVLSEAARHAGKPYRWGATGPDAFDCSGFTGYVYGRLGVPLPRSSSDQYAALPKVAQADKQLGDLVFTYDAGGIYHVGIYAGSNRMWAAPRSGDHVRLQTIWTSSYKVARPVPGRVAQHWIAHGGRTGFLGAPTTGEARTPDGRGAFTHYQGGSVYWSPATDAREVHGGIRATWARLGWERGALGFPTTDERGTPDGRGRFNHFERGGSVYWTPATGAREVRGAIRATWARLGWERSALGFPVTDETAAADGVGRFNHFEGGSIYWTPQTGARELRGGIRDRWQQAGAERSPLGYPTSDERVAPDGTGRSNDFQHGALHWSPTTGYVMVHGPVHRSWLAEGAEAGPLGYPVRDNYPVPGGQAADFQGGTITWDSSTGQTTVVLAAAPADGG
jgi:uncharacterized protein with LGFP repeats